MEWRDPLAIQLTSLFFDLKRLKDVGGEPQKIGSFELACFAIIEGALQKLQRDEIRNGGRQNTD